MRLLYHCPIGTGGLAAYAHEHAKALSARGCEVTLVTGQEFPEHPEQAYRIERIYPAERQGPSRLPRVLRRARWAFRLLAIQFRLVDFIVREGFTHVLMGAYIEYLAPLWAWRFRQLARQGVVFGSVVHDPVRDYVVGPVWWHRRSIAAGFSFIREAFVHAPIVLDTVKPMPALRTTVIPHGPYHYPPCNRPREIVRQELSIPPDAPVLLAFGHLRDGKNLDLAIEAMARFPEMHLIVAGRPQSGACKPGEYYQGVARRCGVFDRCHWLLGYIPDAEVSALFEAADYVLLTYSRSFRSASGVLNTASSFRKPCLASAGDSNLREKVIRYKLGAWVEPDDMQAIGEGLERLLTNSEPSDWEDYERDNSWAVNAARVCECMKNQRSPSLGLRLKQNPPL